MVNNPNLPEASLNNRDEADPVLLHDNGEAFECPISLEDLTLKTTVITRYLDYGTNLPVYHLLKLKSILDLRDEMHPCAPENYFAYIALTELNPDVLKKLIKADQVDNGASSEQTAENVNHFYLRDITQKESLDQLDEATKELLNQQPWTIYSPTTIPTPTRPQANADNAAASQALIAAILHDERRRRPRNARRSTNRIQPPPAPANDLPDTLTQPISNQASVASTGCFPFNFIQSAIAAIKRCIHQPIRERNKQIIEQIRRQDIPQSPMNEILIDQAVKNYRGLHRGFKGLFRSQSTSSKKLLDELDKPGTDIVNLAENYLADSDNEGKLLWACLKGQKPYNYEINLKADDTAPVINP